MADEQRDHKDRRMLVLFLFVSLLILTDLARNTYQACRHPAPDHLLIQAKAGITQQELEKAIFRNPRAAFFLGRPMQLHQATTQDLELLPGIGPVLAQKIILFRDQHGCLHDMEQLRQIRGVGEKMAARLTKQLAFACP